MKDKNWLIGIGSLVAVAAVMIFIRINEDEKKEKPSKKAPQLDIGVPDTQSGFPTSASPSELG